MAKVPKEIKKEILKVTDPHLRKELVKATKLLSKLRIEIAKMPGGVSGRPKEVLGMKDIALLTDAYNGKEYLGNVLKHAENYTNSKITNTINYLEKGILELDNLKKKYGRRY